MLALAMRARSALSSTPSTRRKGNWEARSMARPLPAPMSRKTVLLDGLRGAVRWSQMSNKPWRMGGDAVVGGELCDLGVGALRR